MWTADDRCDLIRANDYPTSGAWLVIVEGVAVDSARPECSGACTKRWIALINGMHVLGGRGFPAATRPQSRSLARPGGGEGPRRHLTSCATPPA